MFDLSPYFATARFIIMKIDTLFLLCRLNEGSCCRTCFPAIHQVTVGGGLAPTVWQLTSYLLPDEMGSRPFKMPTLVGPTEKEEMQKLDLPSILGVTLKKSLRHYKCLSNKTI